ncbi:hypothetical protein [Piscinibacter sp. HJYY11]|uniref:hypothetical protein n=1 Tax=Piscinibacter sp. HJYY11 TaxID=2801333 RepID=UPI00191E1F6B|nr:hypothetical protein [Piscinibacter sp. HJYY11]MBL0726192.1 hypothetical protein [Piscinibacter sp. HJYY11]
MLQRLILSFLILLGATPAWAQSADEAKKAARRAQLQVQQAQQQAQEAQAAKARLETDKAELDKKVAAQSQQVAALRGALPRLQEKLKAAETERDQLADKVAALEKDLAERKLAAEASAVSGERALKQRDEAQAKLKREHDAQVALVGECSEKNERLLQLSAELLDKYRHKTVGDVLKQRDPVLGLGDVKTFNLVQEYRDKAEAERFAPTANR